MRSNFSPNISLQSFKSISEQLQNDFIALTETIMSQPLRYANQQLQDTLINYYIENNICPLIRIQKNTNQSLHSLQKEMEQTAIENQNPSEQQYIVIMNYFVNEIEAENLHEQYEQMLSNLVRTQITYPYASEQWRTQLRKRVLSLLLIVHWIDADRRTKFTNFFDLWNVVFPNDPISSARYRKYQENQKVRDCIKKAYKKSREESANQEDSKKEDESESISISSLNVSPKLTQQRKNSGNKSSPANQTSKNNNNQMQSQSQNNNQQEAEKENICQKLIQQNGKIKQLKVEPIPKKAPLVLDAVPHHFKMEKFQKTPQVLSSYRMEPLSLFNNNRFQFGCEYQSEGQQQFANFSGVNINQINQVNNTFFLAPIQSGRDSGVMKLSPDPSQDYQFSYPVHTDEEFLDEIISDSDQIKDFKHTSNNTDFTLRKDDKEDQQQSQTDNDETLTDHQFYISEIERTFGEIAGIMSKILIQ